MPTASNRNAGLAALGIFVLAFALHADNLGRALLGWDTYATLVAARVESAGDLVGTFSERLMDGRLAFGDFYRPVGNVFVAVDTAIWGLRPMGHQATSLLVFCASAVLLFAVVVRRGFAEPPDRRWLALTPGLLASALFVLHPATLSVLPVVARRTELLMLCFVLAALAVAPEDETEPMHRRWAVGLLSLLAVGSKEPGVVVVPLLLVDRFLASRAPALGDRVREALRFVAPSIAAVALFVAVRTVVLGGLGGYFEAPELSWHERLLDFAPRYLEMVLATGVLGDPPARAAAVTTISVLALALGTALAVFAGRRGEAQRGDAIAPRLRLPALGGCWLVIQIALACLTEKPEPRYALGLVVGTSFLLAGLVEAALASTRASPSPRAPVRAGWLAAFAALPFVCALAGSPLWRPQPALAEASRIETRELAELAHRLDAASAPGRHRMRFTKLVPIPDAAVDHAWMLSPWSLQAWLELAYPDRMLRVETDNLVRPDPRFWSLVIIEEQPSTP